MSEKSGFELLQWNDSLATGSSIIDKQHKMLINILNDANRCFRDHGDVSQQRKVIDDLISYTVYHFDTEEELMHQSGYGEIHSADELAHVREHRSLTEKVSEYQQAIRQGKPIVAAQVFTFLNNWLVNHVMGTDKRLGAFLQAQQK